MFGFNPWTRRVVGVVCCALVGAVWVPARAGAAASSTNQWAAVSKKGVLVRSNGATSATRMTKGRYLVTFAAAMNKCAFEATADNPIVRGFPVPVELTVGQVEGKPKAVFVQTFLQIKGTLVDVPFDLTTYCGTAATDAVVSDAGTLARGSHAVSSFHLATGRYEVFFDHDVHACALTATIGSPIAGEVLIPGEITVAGVSGRNDGVFVRTMARQGADLDGPFHLAVDCGATTLTAVVNGDTTVARSSHLVSVARPAGGGLPSGAYDVIFDRDVTKCSHTATIGVTGSTGTVGDPVTITTAPLHANVKGLFVLTQNITGNPQDEPFHLVVTC
jgi:hypothetical protein